MTTRRPRTTIVAAFALLAVLLGLFAYALLHANSNERADAEQRFRDRAGVSAALTAGIFSSASTTGAQENSRLFGGSEVEQAALDRQAKQGQLSYMAVLDGQGGVLQTSSKVSPELRARLEGKPMVVDAVLNGQPFALSDFIDSSAPGGVMEFASKFKAVDGKDRIVVSGFSGQILAAFIGQYLSSIPDSSNSHAFVVDSKGLVVGSPVRGQLVGKPVNEAGLGTALADPDPSGAYDSDGTERFYTVADVGNSTWRVALTTETADLYAGISSLIEWLLLIALALAGLSAIFLLNRAMRSAAAVQAANEMLEGSNEQLARSNLELQRSNAELEQFASVASHDLQEPLRKVQTFGDQIERRFGDEMPEEAKDYLRRMRSSANRMSTLIEDLLRFSRVTTHAKPPTSVNLTDVAHEVTSDLDALLQKTRGSVDIGDLPTVEADPLQMRQLLQNLIANGIKFHRPGISPEVEVREISSPRPGMAAFTVTDNGIGFEDQYAERIFRVFERLHPRDVFEGTGIGLALCRKIVERHGGTIVAEGRLDEGSTFTVTLPVRPGAEEDPGMPADDREPVHA
jgi:signal transduction histidine kinase